MPGMGIPLKESLAVTQSPAAVSTTVPRSYFMGNLGAPRHKDYGVGTRFVGCSLMGTIRTTNLYQGCFVPTIAHVTGANWFDLLAYYDYTIGFGVNGEQFNFSMHPYFIPRLTNEVYNFARYCYRQIKLVFCPICPTTVDQGYVAGISRGTSDTITITTDADINSFLLQLEDVRVGAFWNGFEISTGDRKGDKTWSCNVPVLASPSAVIPMPTQCPDQIANLVEEYYQFVYHMAMPQTSTATASRGYVYVEYIIDFYEPRVSPAVGIASEYLGAPGTQKSVSRRSPLFKDHSHLLPKQDVEMKDDRDRGNPEPILPAQPDDPFKPRQPIVIPDDGISPSSRPGDVAPLNRSELSRATSVSQCGRLPRVSGPDCRFKERKTAVREEVAMRSRSLEREKDCVGLNSRSKPIEDCECCGQWPCKHDRSWVA